jgi:hypothetical protein
MPTNSGPGGQRRLIFTGNVKTNLFNKYTPGSGVGALSTSVRRKLKRSASSSQGSMNAHGQYIHGNRCCSAELQSKTRNDNITVNQLLVIGNDFREHMNSIDYSSLLETAHTATPSTNNLVFGLKNSSVKLPPTIMKQEILPGMEECSVSNVGDDTVLKMSLSVTHDGPSNPNHTSDIQHDKAMNYIKQRIETYNYNGKSLFDYHLNIISKVDPEKEYGWIHILKNVNIAPLFTNDSIGFSANEVYLKPNLPPYVLFIRLTDPIINTSGTEGLTITLTSSTSNVSISPSVLQWSSMGTDWKTIKRIKLIVTGDSNENILDIIKTTVTSNSELYNNYTPNFTANYIGDVDTQIIPSSNSDA